MLLRWQIVKNSQTTPVDSKHPSPWGYYYPPTLKKTGIDWLFFASDLGCIFIYFSINTSKIGTLVPLSTWLDWSYRYAEFERNKWAWIRWLQWSHFRAQCTMLRITRRLLLSQDSISELRRFPRKARDWFLLRHLPSFGLSLTFMS